jgi:hypothetical protein
MNAHADLYLNGLMFDRNNWTKKIVRTHARLTAAWRGIDHVRRFVILNNQPVLRFEPVRQIQFNWKGDKCI